MTQRRPPDTNGNRSARVTCAALILFAAIFLYFFIVIVPHVLGH